MTEPAHKPAITDKAKTALAKSLVGTNANSRRDRGLSQLSPQELENVVAVQAAQQAAERSPERSPRHLDQSDISSLLAQGLAEYQK
jgi:hypothetical protein